MIAVLLATAAAEDGPPAARSGAPGGAGMLGVAAVSAAVARLATQLRGGGVDEIHVLTRPEWTDELAQTMTPDVAADVAGVPGGEVTVAPVDSPADALEALAALAEGAAEAGEILLLGGNAIAVTEPLRLQGALRGLARQPRPVTGLLPSAAIVAVGSQDCAALASRAWDVALRSHGGWAQAGPSASVDLVALVASAVSVGRGEGAARDEAALPALDEERLRLDSAVKATDGFFTTFFVSPYSKYIARWAARRGLTPNQVTVVSMLLGVAAAAAFATGSRAGLVLGAVVLQLAFTADCVDGQLARYSRQFSPLGAWLDSVFDRSKEYLVFAGLALGATRTGDDGLVWLLATAALALQTTRHAIDFSWGEQQAALGAAADRQDPPDLAVVGGAGEGARGGALASLGNVGVTASQRTEGGWVRWVKRIAVLPIGERFALISITAALWDARTTFVGLLAWGLLALAYSVTGRVLRTVA